MDVRFEKQVRVIHFEEKRIGWVKVKNHLNMKNTILIITCWAIKSKFPLKDEKFYMHMRNFSSNIGVYLI
ncbi:hypothetical protein EEL32_20730 [Brevibacillus laterosporus]|uniref:Uncharacterized protein n=1 Tax=Brevibacillus laterosporus TaxID=1465 RepID=A0A502I1L9_BRELA|nr:hypothetical protein EEL30_09435 [Brevibacillus laterosporus]TPG70832.1 hypothetical protein EEL31_21885 [Brevibacillus laterosporus]TPG80887.1 hypothetical protein EEL32_20730 [Brevibacillus laterosporus]